MYDSIEMTRRNKIRLQFDFDQYDDLGIIHETGTEDDSSEIDTSDSSYVVIEN